MQAPQEWDVKYSQDSKDSILITSHVYSRLNNHMEEILGFLWDIHTYGVYHATLLFYVMFKSLIKLKSREESVCLIESREFTFQSVTI